MRKYIDVKCRVRKHAMMIGFMGALVAGPALADQNTRLAANTEVQSWLNGTTMSRTQDAIQRPSAHPLGTADQRAALEAINYALMEVADGSTFVWRRHTGILRGVVRPTSSFRDDEGRVCRHIVLALSLGEFRKKVEGIACRTETGVWSLSG